MAEESTRRHLYKKKSLRKTSKSGQNMESIGSPTQLSNTGRGSSLQMKHILTLHRKQLLLFVVNWGTVMTQRT